VKSYDFIVVNGMGFHARPAGKFTKIARSCHSSITVKKGEACADARHVFALMQMDIRQGDQIIFAVDGSDEDAVLDKIRTFCQEEL